MSPNAQDAPGRCAWRGALDPKPLVRRVGRS